MYPALLLVLMWSFYLLERITTFDFYKWGIFPKDLLGLRGIIFSPLLHSPSDFGHILNNSGPIAILFGALIYFYRQIAAQIFLYSWLITGLFVWVFAINTGVLTAGYKFYPVGKEQKVNFYFHYSLKHYIYFSKFNGSSSNTRNYNENFLGYGFDVPIGKRFYFNHDLGVGVLTEWEVKSNNANLSIDGNFRLGFGYKFGEKK